MVQKFFKQAKLKASLAMAGIAGAAMFAAPVAVLAAPNTPPVSSFTYTRLVGAGSGNKVSLNGSGSYDPDGTVVTWKWYKNGAQFGTGKVLTASMNSSGVTDVTLVVTDNQGATGSSTQTVLTPNRAPLITSVNPVDGATVDSLTPTLKAVGKDYDGDFLLYHFTLTGTGVNLESDYLFSGSWTVPTDPDSNPYLVNGETYTWTVQVMDSRGALSDVRTSTFTVALP